MKHTVCFFVLLLLNLVSCTEFEPNKIETLRAFDFQTPQDSWGLQARQEKELRLFAFGGSNTRNCYYADAINDDFAKTKTHPDWKASFDRIGLGGVHDVDVIGMKFEFEYLDHSRWPNVIMLEFSANIDVWTNATAAETIDSIVCVIRRKYNVVHLPEPDFMFLELFNVRHVTEDMLKNPHAGYEHKLHMIEKEISSSNMCDVVPFHHCANYFAIRRVAAFYDYPIVSWRELGLNAFVRYYLASKDSFETKPWKYHMDGMHINGFGGILLYNTLLGPFFHQIMKPRKESKRTEKGQDLVGKRMFPPSNKTLDLMPRVIRGTNVTHLVRQPSQWQPMWAHGRDPLTCSSDKAARLILDVVIPLECDHVDTCSMSVGFLHSWNASHVGSLDCEVRSAQFIVGRVVVNSSLDERGKPMVHTGSIGTNINVPTAGKYSVTCDKLDDKLTCVTTFAARVVMEV